MYWNLLQQWQDVIIGISYVRLLYIPVLNCWGCLEPIVLTVSSRSCVTPGIVSHIMQISVPILVSAISGKKEMASSEYHRQRNTKVIRCLSRDRKVLLGYKLTTGHVFWNYFSCPPWSNKPEAYKRSCASLYGTEIQLLKNYRSEIAKVTVNFYSYYGIWCLFILKDWTDRKMS